MSLDQLRESIPAYAKDLSLNLSSLAAETLLTDQQKWGCFVACAYAGGTGAVIKAVEAEAAQAGLSDDAKAAAKAAAAIMAMNNVYYRALHLMTNPEYKTLPARLRMNIIATHGVDRIDFELWCTAVSAINGCGACLDSHEEELKKHGVPIDLRDALRKSAGISKGSSKTAAPKKTTSGPSRKTKR